MPSSRHRPGAVLAIALGAAAAAQQPLFNFSGSATGDQAGASVALAGDVDGDGLADVVVGAPAADTGGIDSGRTQVLSGADGSVLYTFDGAAAGDRFGASVAGAGDVDGDGLADVIVGAPGADPGGADSGRAQVFSGADGTVLYTFDGAAAGDGLGASVAGAGDVDGDGWADLIVGAPGSDNAGVDAGRARVLSGRNGSSLHTLDGDSAGDRFGSAVAPAGDIDGDCADDLIIGSPDADPGGASSGRAVVLSGADSTNLLTFEGGAAGDRFGAAVAGAGDVDGDGIADLIAGAPEAAYNGALSGRAQVLSGSDGSVLLTVDGGAPGDRLGAAVSGAGDADHDGNADVLVGAPGAGYGGAGSGRAQVLSASAGVLRTFDGAAPGDRAGTSVAGAQDVNSDGFADTVVGAPGDPATSAGSAWVFALAPFDELAQLVLHGDGGGDRFGRGVDTAGDVDDDGVLDFVIGAPQDPGSGYARVFSGVDHSVLRTLAGGPQVEHFGTAVDGVGDVNGDGFDDVIVGAPHHTPAEQLAGRAAVYSGLDGSIVHEWFGIQSFAHAGFAVGAGGDVDNDGTPDVLVGFVKENPNRSGAVGVFAGPNGTEIWMFHGDGQDDFLGWSVHSAGDLNGDGHDDVIAGAPENRVGGVVGPGYARVYSGIDGTTIYTFAGANVGDMLGFSVSGGGDCDADGVPDLLVGAWGDDDNGTDSGRVTVFSGADGTVLHQIDGGAAGDQLGFTVDMAGDLDGDGFADFLAGAPGSDVGAIADAGQVLVFSGGDGSVLATLDGSSTLTSFGSEAAASGDINGDGYPEMLVGAFSDDSSGVPSGSAYVYESSVVSDPGSFSTYGAPCAGSNGFLPRIHASGRPVLGLSFGVSLSSAMPGATVAAFLGATQQILPLGGSAPGCALLTLPALSVPTIADASGKASLGNIAVPNAPSLVGVALYVQWVVVDGAANALGVSTSDGVCVTIGLGV